MPLYYLFQLIPAWLRSEGVDLKTIGLFALVQLPYNYKFLWSPLLDRFVPPLGRRRGWMLISQICLLLGMMSLALYEPVSQTWTIAYTAFAIAFFSSTQDIALDAYRRELLPDRELGLGNSMYANAYRISGFVPGGLSLILADHVSWSTVHLITAMFMFIGIAKTLLISEAKNAVAPPASLRDAVILPVSEFFKRDGVSSALYLLAFLFCYKLGDVMATALSTPFYLDLGFTKTVIGTTVKLVGVWSSLIGGLIGGIVIYQIGINRSLWIFGVVQMLTILGFAWLSEAGQNPWVLSVVVGAEYLGVGLGSAALIAFMSRATNVNFTGTQFAIFSSIMSTPRTFAAAFVGFLIEGISKNSGTYYETFGAWKGLGYTKFFFLCTVLAIPGMLLLLKVAPWNEPVKPQPVEPN